MSLEFGPVANAAFSYLAYDEYVLDEHEDQAQQSFIDDGMPLSEYKRLVPMVVEANDSAYEDGCAFLPGETDQFKVHEVPTNQCKQVIRTLLKALKRNELRSICISLFTEANVFVSSAGNVKLRNVRVRRDLNEDELREGQRGNYQSVQQIIRYLFDWNPPPEDIQHLLNLIETEYAKELWHIHGSLVLMEMYSAFFTEMYDVIRFVLPKEDLRDILSSLPYIDSWKGDIVTNNLLKVTFDRNPKSYQVPQKKISKKNKEQTCLNKDQKEVYEVLGLTIEKGQRDIKEEHLPLIKALQFLDFLRNRTSHRMEPLKKWIQDENQAYNAAGSELVSYVRFRTILVHLQEQLYRKNMHRHVPMEKYF